MAPKLLPPGPGEIRALRMDPPMGRQCFEGSDPRAGAYEPHQIYLVPEELSLEKAKALIDGGGYVACERPQEGVSTDAPDC